MIPKCNYGGQNWEGHLWLDQSLLFLDFKTLSILKLKVSNPLNCEVICQNILQRKMFMTNKMLYLLDTVQIEDQSFSFVTGIHISCDEAVVRFCKKIQSYDDEKEEICYENMSMVVTSDNQLVLAGGYCEFVDD